MSNYNIPLSQPDINESDIQAVVDVMRSNQLSLGPKLVEFENKFKELSSAKYAVAMNSGTSVLHTCIRALEIADGDEVITSPYSFIASSNCILFERAKPVFVDIDPETLCIDPKLIQKAVTSKTKAILPIHVFGLPCDMDAIMQIAREKNLAVIEDSCEAIGAEYKGKPAGTLGDCGVFAFYPNKQMTTGEGGVLVTNNEKIAKLCASMRNQGRDEGMGWLSHTRLGYNYRLSDINCALGIEQIKRLPQFLAQRAQVAAWYDEIIAEECPQLIKLCKPEADCTRSWFVYVVQIPYEYSEEQRNDLIYYLRSKGIGCNQYFPPIHLQPFYYELGYRRGDFPITELVGSHSFSIPFFNKLSKEKAVTVIREIKNWLNDTPPQKGK